MIDFLKKLNIPFKDILLYETALTHASYAHEQQVENNERLEFLGDAVIELLMSDYLFKRSQEKEGEMTKKRAQAVCEEALVTYAKEIELQQYIRIGKGEVTKGPNQAMIADAFEALFGAIYLDLGFITAKKVFKQLVHPQLNKVLQNKDYKSTLQEYIQSGDKRNLSYQTIKETGPSHDREFVCIVKLDNHIILGTGMGKTKKEAEQMAAKDALEKGAK